MAGALTRLGLGEDGINSPMRTRIQGAFGFAALVAVTLVPLWLSPFYLILAENALVLALLGLGLSISLGICRQANFGITPYYALGAYGVGNIASRWHVGAIGALVIVTAVSGIVAYPIGRVILRLAQFTLALATFVIATAIWEYISVGLPERFGGGANGLVLPRLSVFGFSIFGDAGYFLPLTVLLLAGLAVGLLMRTRTGRAFHALGQDPTAAEASGINVRHFGALGYAFSASVVAAAGGLFMYTTGTSTPDGFDVGVNITALLIVVVGGLTTLVGPVFGAALIVALNQLLGSSLAYSGLIEGLILLGFIRFVPDGIAGRLAAGIEMSLPWKAKGPPAPTSVVEEPRAANVEVTELSPGRN